MIEVSSISQVLAGYVLPHPPVIVPGVSREPLMATKTVSALRQLAASFAELRPETVVIISPHAPLFSDYLFMYDNPVLEGSLSRFGAPQARLSFTQDEELLHEIKRRLEQGGISGGGLSASQMRQHEIDADLDHGVIVPLYFLAEKFAAFKLVAMSCSNLPLAKLYQLGDLIRQAAARLNRRIVLVASGDQSHKVNDESPYGSCPEGAEYDAAVVAGINQGNLQSLLEIDAQIRNRAAECGYRSLVILCGAFSRQATLAKVLSYEAPYGIGYCVGEIKPDTVQTEPIDDIFQASLRRQREQGERRRQSASTPVIIARETLEAHVRDHLTRKAREFANLPNAAALFSIRAGAFVSLKKFGELRGCIGTTAPTTASLVDEIMQNALSAGLHDPRFEPVDENELQDLTYSVDVLSTPEPINDRSKLDPVRYGVIVRSGSRSGLLLPDLEGVDTVDGQLEIACRKAGIRSSEPFEMLRFRVTRYT